MASPQNAQSKPLRYETTSPPLEVTFDVEGKHYSGKVTGGNLFLQSDISVAPTVKCAKAKSGKFYTLMMLDFDGNANGSWPDPVPPGENSPVRHWIVCNIPGATFANGGYKETKPGSITGITVLQEYRAPHIPIVSDRYALYIFEQSSKTEFSKLSGSITNFDYSAFLQQYRFREPIASNYFVAVYTSESPFSGKPFRGNDVSDIWQKSVGQGTLER